MPISTNSLLAFDSIDLTARQTEVLDAIRAMYAAGKYPTDQDIADWLVWPINRVTGRRGELVSAGRVQKAGSITGPAGRPVMTWMPVPEQLTLLGDPT